MVYEEIRELAKVTIEGVKMFVECSIIGVSAPDKYRVGCTPRKDHTGEKAQFLNPHDDLRRGWLQSLHIGKSAQDLATLLGVGVGLLAKKRKLLSQESFCPGDRVLTGVAAVSRCPSLPKR